MNDAVLSNNEVQQWQKLSPLALVYFVLHFVVRFIKDGLLNLAPVMVIFVTQVENKLFWGSIGLALFILGLVVYSVFYYLNFRFKVTDHEVILRKGVMKKERVTLNFAKIQNVNISVPFYFQPFNLVNCTFDAAGSSDQEVGLPGIVSSIGHRMRETIFAYKQQSGSDDELVMTSPTIDEPTFSLRNTEVAKFGLMSSMMFLVLAAFAPFSKHIIEFSQARFVEPLATILTPFIGNLDHALIVAVLIVVFTIITLFIGASVFGAVLRFYNYQLFVEGSKVKRVSGLLERHQMSVSTAKIQAIEVKQNWVGMLLRRVIVTCKQIENSQNPSAKKGQSLIIPVLERAYLEPLLTLCGQACQPSSVPLVSIHSKYLRKNFVLFSLLPVLTITLLIFMVNKQVFWPHTMFVLGVGGLLCFMRYKRYGFYTDGEQVFLRSGFIGHTVTIFSIDKIQQVQKTQTPMMKKAGLSSLTIQLASGRLEIPYLPNDLVTEFMDLALYQAENKPSDAL